MPVRQPVPPQQRRPEYMYTRAHPRRQRRYHSVLSPLQLVGPVQSCSPTKTLLSSYSRTHRPVLVTGFCFWRSLAPVACLRRRAGECGHFLRELMTGPNRQETTFIVGGTIQLSPVSLRAQRRAQPARLVCASCRLAPVGSAAGQGVRGINSLPSDGDSTNFSDATDWGPRA